MMSESPASGRRTLLWLRRDLRLDDNPALNAACMNSRALALVYIHACAEEAPWEPGAASRWWLHHSLKEFNSRLTEQGQHLILRCGSSLQHLLALCNELKIRHVYWNQLYDPAVCERDQKIVRVLQQNGIETEIHFGYLLREPKQALNRQGNPYKVFTSFYKQQYLHEYQPGNALQPPALPQTIAPAAGYGELDSLQLSDGLPQDQKWGTHWSPGEKSAQSRLHDFIHHVEDYQNKRDFPATNGVSRLSPSLHFGEISVRRIWREMDSIPWQTQVFKRQLVWRDFAHHLLCHFPYLEQQPFQEKFRNLAWAENTVLMRRWQQADTGITTIDAAMRELSQSGWMHNRMRMLVASLLCKNGLLNWLEGAHWFWERLVDANLANNTMGWQWTAGCGVDAAPYFRIFNPVLQGKRFDPQGEYIKRWLPELSELPEKYIHDPVSAPADILHRANIRIGTNWPEPVLDLAATRRSALEFHRNAGG